jgi:GNAT superfamily N-acetyltransferase
MLPVIRGAQARDINYLIDIDIKSYHFPWSVGQWRKFAGGKMCSILLATIKAEPVAVCAWKKSGKDAEILRLATKPAYRGLGAASLLLYTVESTKLQKVSIIIPEINCFPGQPDDISAWLLSRGYQATVPILKDYFHMYGKHYDGFKFVRFPKGEKHA